MYSEYKLTSEACSITLGRSCSVTFEMGMSFDKCHREALPIPPQHHRRLYQQACRSTESLNQRIYIWAQKIAVSDDCKDLPWTKRSIVGSIWQKPTIPELKRCCRPVLNCWPEWLSANWKMRVTDLGHIGLRKREINNWSSIRVCEPTLAARYWKSGAVDTFVLVGDTWRPT